MKNAFTLIEVVAILAILAILALITTPIVLDVINDTKAKSFTQEAYTLINAAQTYQADSGYGSTLNFEWNSTDNETLQKLKVEGEYPEYGHLSINENGKVKIAIWDSALQICLTKGITQKEVTVYNDITSWGDCNSKYTALG